MWGDDPEQEVDCLCGALLLLQEVCSFPLQVFVTNLLVVEQRKQRREQLQGGGRSGIVAIITKVGPIAKFFHLQFDTKTKETTEQAFAVDFLKRHDGFREDGYLNDIMLIRVKKYWQEKSLDNPAKMFYVDKRQHPVRLRRAAGLLPRSGTAVRPGPPLRGKRVGVDRSQRHAPEPAQVGNSCNRLDFFRSSCGEQNFCSRVLKYERMQPYPTEQCNSSETAYKG